ncbi:MAG: GNAT family N-acetyltransferase [bacterium]
MNGKARLEVRTLAPEHWRPVARLTTSISRELRAEAPRPLKTQLAILSSPWLKEEDEALVLTETGRVIGYGWARDLPWRGRTEYVHTGLFLAPEARSPDRYRLLTDRLLESARRIARERGRLEAWMHYRSIDTVHPPIVRAIGFRDTPVVMLGFSHDLTRIPDLPPPPGLDFRPARFPEELPLIRELARRSFTNPETEGEAVEQDFWDLWAADFTADPELLIVADAGGGPVGYLAVALAETPSFAAEIAETAVAPEWRRRGIASHLASRALRHCRKRRLRRVVLSELSASPAAAMLWRLGFRPDAVRTYYFYTRPLDI